MAEDNAYKVKWGILSTGWIAHQFATDLAHASNGTAYAVGSRSQESADKFAADHGIPVAYATYEELVNDPDVDAIYIGTPHPFHRENALLALRAGKAVLCEKPFTVNRGELEEVVAYAREHKLFLMEAMWSRYIPAHVKVREWLAAGRIGEVKLVKADLGFRSDWKPEGRLLNPALGGERCWMSASIRSPSPRWSSDPILNLSPAQSISGRLAWTSTSRCCCPTAMVYLLHSTPASA